MAEEPKAKKRGIYQDHYEWARRNVDDPDAKCLLDAAKLHAWSQCPASEGIIIESAARIEKKPEFIAYRKAMTP